ncbi:peroxiredoxin [Dysgonomonas sp. PH5-45]|uniref:peroxiredoxin family protein n=1 Tax=unclassified Dysgonomonas TaxID=2630389 RepID=UPI00247613A6|nr:MULTISPECIES: redoxin domain-containing protein [unclassified Dysgonomonas]MDH6355587.1 peroxiredoxin [Dysgonomonas sp. PH5-45]MDH6388503.1 peroxiredoxin [Dysgonomonas sp. PH5-37]
MQRKHLFCLLLVLIGIYAQVQSSIHVSFSQFPLQDYVLVTYRGTHIDTIASGSLNITGSGDIQIPASSESYRGIASLILTGKTSIDFVLDNEPLSIHSEAVDPNFSNMIFTGSPENSYLQDHIMGRAGVESIDMTLYAERFLQTTLYFQQLNNFGNFTPSQTEEMRRFATQELDMDVLYHSSLWRPLISYWVGFVMQKTDSDDYLIGDAVKIINNMRSEEVMDEFGNNMIEICEQYDWNYVKTQIVLYMYNSGRIKNPTKNLLISMKSIGVVVGEPPVDFEISQKKRLNDYLKNNILLFFYENNCSHCDDEKKKLIEAYPELKKQGIVVVSIAANEDRAKNLPWEDNISDTDGKLFANYGIIGTPTYFFIKDGKIASRAALLKNAVQ